jgi:phage tail sheath protein FI
MPQVTSYPGVYIEELPSGVRPVVGVATSIAAFVGYTPRGPENLALRLASFGDYERRFGGLDRESELGFAVQQFFRNGGSDAIVVRIPKSDAQKASVTLRDTVSDAGGANALVLTAASSGTWGNALTIDIGHGGASDAQSFNLTVTDQVTGTTERFADLSAAPDSPRFAVTRLNDPDSGSALLRARPGVDGAGRPAAAGTQGSDIFPLASVDATKRYRMTVQPDLPVEVAPGSLPQPEPAVDPVMVEVLAVGERVPSSIGGLCALVERKINAALRAADGAAGLAVRVVPSGSGAGLRILGAVSPELAPDAVDAAFAVSSVAPAGDVADAAALLGLASAAANVGIYTPAGTVRAALGAATRGTGGTLLPGAGDLIGTEAAFSGIYALLKTDIFNLLCIPDATRAKPGSPREVADGLDPDAIWAAALDLCVRRRAMLMVDPPPGVDDTERAADWINGLGAKSPNSVATFPRLRIPDPTDRFQPRTVAPSGTLAGVFARTDGQRGVWKAPAGIEARLQGVAGLEYRLTDPENGILNPLGLNSIRVFPVTGIVNWGARTTEGADLLASQWKYVPVRRLALFIEESVFRGTQWAVFEPNDEPLWSQLRLNLTSFMHDLFRKGAFAGATPSQAYLVKCDSETTTPDDVDRGVVNVLVGFAPLKPAEFVIIRIQQLAAQTAAA